MKTLVHFYAVSVGHSTWSDSTTVSIVSKSFNNIYEFIMFFEGYFFWHYS